MATRRVRLDPCRLLRRHVLGWELACDGAKNPGRSGACLHREEGEPGEVKEGLAGMAEANATTESATSAQDACVWHGADYAGEGAPGDVSQAPQ